MALRIRPQAVWSADGLEIIANSAMWSIKIARAWGGPFLQVHSRLWFGQQTGIELPSETRV